MKKVLPLILSLMICSLAFAGEPDRSSQWAVPMPLPGAGNFYKINDHLYRSEQPSRQGMKNLEKMGIKTIINLRPFHSDKSRLKGTKLSVEDIDVKTWHIEDEDVIKVLKFIRKKENGPFLIHCQHGADRTGLMIAMYRIVEQGWSKDEAVKEMVEGGYGFHPIWSNIIDYINNVNIEKITSEVTK